jgi:hypothetical protein
MRLESRDWAGLLIGWCAALIAYFLIPEGEPKFALVFLCGFAGAWVTRAIMA